MTPAHEEHLRELQKEIRYLLDVKYRDGNEHHGGFLLEKDPMALADEIIAESIDKLVYALTLKKVLKRRGY
jgi:hypothetical protein